MNCSKCQKKNIKTANYCKYCGNEFSEEERDKAYKKTIYYKLSFLEDRYNDLTLSSITSHWLFRVITIILILGYGLILTYINGNDLNINKNDNYELYYNDKTKDYFVIVEDGVSSVSLDLYVPNKIKKLSSIHYNLDNKVIETIDYKKDDNIVFSVYDEDYYILKGIYNNDKEKNLKIHIYEKGKVDIQK